MSLSDKNIVITPNIGATGDPKISFTGADSSSLNSITLSTYPQSGGILSFDGSFGQVFSMTGTGGLSTYPSVNDVIFSVNDLSGIPSFQIFADGSIKFAPYGTGLSGNKFSLGGINFTNSWSDTPSTGTTISEISNDSGTYKTLMIIGNRSATGGSSDRRVGIWDKLSVNDAGYTYNFQVTGSGYATADFRAPVFKDSNNTAYLLDPNGTSVLYDSKFNTITAGSRINATSFNANQTGLTGTFPLEVRGAKVANGGLGQPFLSLHYENTASRHFTLNSSGTIQLVSPTNEDTPVFEVTNGTIFATKFIDYDNNNYYLDPAGTSYIGGIKITPANNGATGNQIRFYGISGDGGGAYSHSGIIERQWGTADQSELLLFHGNDPYTTTVADRLKIAASGRIVFHSLNGYATLDEYLSSSTYDADGAGSLYIDGKYTFFPSGSYLGRAAHSSGYFVGSYNNVGANGAKTNPIYTIGSSYLPTDTALSNMYGIGYSNTIYGDVAGSAGWGLYVASAGVVRAVVGGETFTWIKQLRTPLIYGDSGTEYYIQPGGVSNLNSLIVGNRALSSTTSIDMSSSSYDRSKFYPVKIPLNPHRFTTMRIQSALDGLQSSNINSENYLSWAGHGSGFTLHVEWTACGSGWGVVPTLNRRIHHYIETWTNPTGTIICGGITQLTYPSWEIIYLRGGGKYDFHCDNNITLEYSAGPVNFTSTDNGTVYNQSAPVISSPINDVWTSATSKSSLGTLYVQSKLGINQNSPACSLDVVDNSSTDYVMRAISSSTEQNWSSRVASVNTAGAKSSFLGVYKRSDSAYTPGVFATNSDLSAWAKLYINTVYDDATTGGGGDVVIAGSGNVGIGTGAPQNKIHVIGNVLAANGNYPATTDTSKLIGVYLNANETAPGLDMRRWTGTGTAHGTGFIRTDSGANMLFYTDSKSTNTVATSERMRIDSSGNVGIGTSSPETPLTVKTNANGYRGLKVEDYLDSSGVYCESVSGGTYKYISADSNYYTSGYFKSRNTTSALMNLYNGVVSFCTNSGLTPEAQFAPTVRMRIDSSGNVGIGTTSPAQRIHVSTTAAVSGTTQSFLRLMGDTYGADFGGGIIQGVGPIATISTVTAGTATERMRIDSSGNVGIGTASPSVLTGYRSVTVNGTTGSLFDSMVNETLTGRIQASSGEYAIGAQGSSTRLSLYTNGSERVRVAADGTTTFNGTVKINNGIGMANVQYIAVNGHNVAMFVANNKVYTTTSTGNHGRNNTGHYAWTDNGLASGSITIPGTTNNNYSFVSLEGFRQVYFPETTATIKQAGMDGLASFVLFDNGNLYRWGYNSSGGLGLGNRNGNSYPTPTLSNTSVAEVYWHPSQGDYNMENNRIFIKKNDGTFWGVGYNVHGQLGLSSATQYYSTWQNISSVISGKTIKKIWCLGSWVGATFFETTDGKLYACGYNSYGQLGTGKTTDELAGPVDVTSKWLGTAATLPTVVKITGGFGYYDGAAVSRTFVALLRSDGVVMVCGDNSHAQCGDGTQTNRSTPATPTGLPTTITDIAVTGGSPSAVWALTSGGAAWSWGYNDYGCVGTGTNGGYITVPASRATSVEKLMFNCMGSAWTMSYQSNVIIKKTDGTYWACGSNKDGNCGIGNVNSTDTIATLTKMMIPPGFEVYGFSKWLSHSGGNNNFSGDSHFCSWAISTDGRILGWGYQLTSGIIEFSTGDAAIWQPILINPPIGL